MKAKKTTATAERSQLTGLTPIQERAAKLLATGLTEEETADTVGIAPEELQTWRNYPAFECYLNNRRTKRKHAQMDAVLNLGGEAITALADLLNTAEPETRCKIAFQIIDRVAGAKWGATAIQQLIKDRHKNDFGEDTASYKADLKRLGLIDLIDADTTK